MFISPLTFETWATFQICEVFWLYYRGQEKKLLAYKGIVEKISSQ